MWYLGLQLGHPRGGVESMGWAGALVFCEAFSFVFVIGTISVYPGGFCGRASACIFLHTLWVPHVHLNYIALCTVMHMFGGRWSVQVLCIRMRQAGTPFAQPTQKHGLCKNCVRYTPSGANIIRN